jgi:hypothetical protein
VRRRVGGHKRENIAGPGVDQRAIERKELALLGYESAIGRELDFTLLCAPSSVPQCFENVLALQIGIVLK